MALYFLSYDLRKNRNYQALYDELASFDATRVLESVWSFHRINTTTSALRDHFAKHIDNDDGIVVLEVSSWATRNVLATPE
jgi:hypothetical protein